jgi:hypothetical protein
MRERRGRGAGAASWGGCRERLRKFAATLVCVGLGAKMKSACCPWWSTVGNRAAQMSSRRPRLPDRVLFGLTAGQPTLLQDAKHWLGSRKAAEANAVSEDFERGNRVVRRLFIGPATVLLDGWEHLRTVLRIQTETFDGTAEPRVDERYLISSMPSVRLTADHWLLVARRHCRDVAPNPRHRFRGRRSPLD